MKRLILIFIVVVFTLSVKAQKQPYVPYRTNGSTMPKDSSLAVGYMLIPTFTSASISGYADRWGSNFGVNRTNSRLSLRGNGAFVEFPSYTEVQSMIASGGVVSSVFGRTGAVIAQTGDYSAFYPILSGSYANPSWISSLAWSKITGTPTTLAGYAISDAVPSSRTVNGQALSSNVTLLTTNVAEGTNLYATNARSLLYVLTGYTAGTNTVLTAGTTYLDAFRNLQAQITAGGTGASNLALGTPTSTTYPITNSNGTGFTLPSATTSLAGLMSGADKTTFNGIPTAYIQNLTGSTQTASFNISGSGVFGASVRVGTSSTLSAMVPVVTSSDATYGIIIKGFSATQTADLQRWQTSGGANVAKIDPSGNVTGASFIKTGGTSSQFLKADGSVDANTYITNGAVLAGGNVFSDTQTFTSTISGSSGLAAAPFNIFPTVAQSGTANYRAFHVGVYEQSVGSNPLKYLADFGTYTGAGGTGTYSRKFQILNTGDGFAAGAFGASSLYANNDISAGGQLAGAGLTLPTVTPSYAAGKMVYDASCDCYTMYNSDSNVSLQIGQEGWIRVINNTGSTIPNGSAVYLSGASGGLPTIGLAKADAATTTIGAGLTTESIANGATGFVTSWGLVNGLNTSGFTTGAVYISATTAGALTQTAPGAGNFRYRVGIVTNVNATTGSINVTPSTAVRDNITVTGTPLDFPNVAMNQNSTLTVSAPGAAIGDVVVLGLPNSILTGLTWNATFLAWVSAADVVSVRFQNNDPLATHDLASAFFGIKIIK